MRKIKYEPQAKLHNEKLSAISLDDALKMAMRLHQTNDFAAAEDVYRKILIVSPDNPDVMHFLGMLRHQRGFSAEGAELIKKALEIVPDYIDALNNLGNVYLQTGHPEQALPCYQRVLELNPDFVSVYGNLGVAYRQLKQYNQAIDFLRKALVLEPRMAHHFQNLGHVYQDLKQYREAIGAYRSSLDIKPGESEIYPELIRTFYLMDQKDVCLEVMREWLAVNPDHPLALHSLAAFTGENLPDRASDDYVRMTFDRFADSFDGVLKRLEYKAPYLVRDAVKLLPYEANRWCLLDAGCGTGLAGVLLRPMVKTMIGVDLSPKMLDRARQREVYDKLYEAELTAFFKKAKHRYDVITCVDTLCYFGDLSQVISSAGQALKPAGYFVFTLEKSPDELQESFNLQIHGRYNHSFNYVQLVLSAGNFAVVKIETATLRFENEEAVVGFVVTAQRI